MFIPLDSVRIGLRSHLSDRAGGASTQTIQSKRGLVPVPGVLWKRKTCVTVAAMTAHKLCDLFVFVCLEVKWSKVTWSNQMEDVRVNVRKKELNRQTNR